ncbi:TPA: AAA family ATPase, partial [Yersinia enterocolitica]|nr:AAA family ATPase [Yersinia enterocolitica]
VRRNLDFFSSVLLKALPVPDASSGILGNILYALSNDTVAYEFLESRYAGSIPCIFQSADADEMVFRIFVCLGIQGKLNNILENKINQRYVSVDDFENIFQFSTTPIVGNKSYIETPIHFFENARKYVHVRKNIISDSASIDLFNNILEELCSNSLVVKDNGNFLFVSKSRGYYLSTINDGRNVIYYGAPGTGKSHAINEETKGSLKILTVFHPDTQYSDFVGALKPKMDSGSITYQFRPGPFTNALITAFSNPDKKVYLVIEEINRAPAAAVFGELFQLLDRENGASKYRINATDPDMIDYINEHLTGVTLDQLFIPGNLSLLATMNSSDQAVMPMDTAFKRRWSFKYIKIDFSQDAVPKQKFNITTSNGIYEISWPNFAQLINKELVKNRIPEDRLLGPFFLSYDELASSLSAKETLKGKLFVYLWNDVLRHLGTNKIFASSYNTFGDLADSFEMEKTVFNLSVEALIEAAGKPVAIENNDSKDDAVSE